MERVNIFWTAGLDSTCRVVELAVREGFEIQPYYIQDLGRRSSDIEMEHIRKMTDVIRSSSATRSTLLDLIVVPKESIRIYDDISGAFLALRKEFGIGKQYRWLASFARQEGIVLELSLEKGEFGATKAILESCKLEHFEGSQAGEYRIVPEGSGEYGRLVFEGMAYPESLWEMTKEEEAAFIRSVGFSDVYELTWFCHRPIFGMPCGHCHPCRQVKDAGMGYRIPMKGRILYYFVSPVRSLARLWRRYILGR